MYGRIRQPPGGSGAVYLRSPRSGSSAKTAWNARPDRPARSASAAAQSTWGYWNRPEINEHRFRGGWWHTTDLGRRETDGTITFFGTMTRMIKSGAENIFPAEVENCLEAHPAVREAAVIGVPSERFLQDVKAVVVLKGTAPVTAAELIEHCRRNIASYKKPKTVEFFDALPRVGGGKDYAALDEKFGGGGYPGGDNLGGGH